MGHDRVRVGWRVATDDSLRRVVGRGTAVAFPELAHSVHVEVEGLRPGRDYFYQFDVGDEESAVGHFRTAPREDDMVDRLRFAFATCQDWPSGYYTAYRDMIRNDLDLVLHLGDYTYEYAIEGQTLRGIPAPAGFEPETVDLRTYRLRHTLYKLDPDLQAAHARFPFVVVWDDHEVANDYSGIPPEFAADLSRVRGEAGRRLPGLLRAHADPHLAWRDTRAASYASTGVSACGRLAEFTMLDDRQYRSDNPCGTARRRAARRRSPATTRCSVASRSAGWRAGSSGRTPAGTSWGSSCSWPSWITSINFRSGSGTTPGTAIPRRAGDSCRRSSAPAWTILCS